MLGHRDVDADRDFRGELADVAADGRRPGAQVEGDIGADIVVADAEADEEARLLIVPGVEMEVDVGGRGVIFELRKPRP
jgi:hypothetical protein